MHHCDSYENMVNAFGVENSKRWKDVVELLNKYNYFNGVQCNYTDHGHIDMYDIEIGWESAEAILYPRIGISACFNRMQDCEILLYWPFIDDYDNKLWDEFYDMLDKILNPNSKEHIDFINDIIDSKTIKLIQSFKL